jgi:hypothetical protein
MCEQRQIKKKKNDSLHFTHSVRVSEYRFSQQITRSTRTAFGGDFSKTAGTCARTPCGDNKH